MPKCYRFRHKTARGPVFTVKRVDGDLGFLPGPKPPPGYERLGLCAAKVKRRMIGGGSIYLHGSLRGWDIVDTALHELLHAEFPQASEATVMHLSGSLFRMVRKSVALAHKIGWKNGGRRAISKRCLSKPKRR